MTPTGALEAHLRARRSAGHKLLVPYVTAGLGQDWTGVVTALAAAGADAVEIGVPFSDPVMDGPTIQDASKRSLDAGTTPPLVLSALAHLDVGIPLAVMTYYNLVFHAGHRRMAASLAASGVAGAILPDLPLEEVVPWADAADASGVETVMLVAPSTPADRVGRICERARGFVYGVGMMGVTGERARLAPTSISMAERLKAATDKPVLIGVGVSTPEQAASVCEHADGVVIGSVLVRHLIEGAGPAEAAELVAGFRRALDA